MREHVQTLFAIHQKFIQLAKESRMRCGKGKYLQDSFEKSMAQEYGYEKHHDVWVLMDRKDGLKLPEYAVKAFEHLELLDPNTPSV